MISLIFISLAKSLEVLLYNSFQFQFTSQSLVRRENLELSTDISATSKYLIADVIMIGNSQDHRYHLFLNYKSRDFDLIRYF